MKTLNVVCGVVKIGDCYLIAQRKDCDHEYIWEFPGGKVEANETNEQAIIRELKEELNIECQVIDYLCKVEDVRSDKIINVYAYLCEKLSGEITLCDHHEYKLVKHEKLINYQFEPCDHIIFDHIKNKELMNKKLNEVKVFRDPIHGYIHVEDQIIWDLINSSLFQRLRRICQLGGVSILYHGATHNRFAHSLGVYEIVLRMCNEITSIKQVINEYERILLLCSALLHDLGHGPLSHVFELSNQINHEKYTIQMIKEDQQIHSILFKYHPNLIQDIILILNKQHPRQFFNQIISSQLDADRMDYLLRDAYYCATSYGNYDLERLLRTIRVYNDELVVKYSGIYCVEDYIMARYHMYWQVYLHPVVRSYELMIQSLLHALNDLDKTYFKVDNLKQYQMMDDAYFYYILSKLQNDHHFIISYLSKNILNRYLLQYEDFNEEKFKQLSNKGIELGYNPKYFIILDEIKKDPYLPYISDKKEKISILMENNKICELSEVSEIVSALSKMDVKKKLKVYYPK